MAQLVKNPLAVQLLGWEGPLEEDMATHPNVLVWRIPKDRGACLGYSPWGGRELDMTEHCV